MLTNIIGMFGFGEIFDFKNCETRMLQILGSITMALIT